MPFARFSPEAPARSVRQTVTDPAMVARARRLGELVAKERGVDTACGILEQSAEASKGAA
ncbi:hypothetical protein [Streptomyces sp. NPDC001781]